MLLIFYCLLQYILLNNLCSAEAVQQHVKSVIACVGDSITKGSGASNRSVTAYPALLQEHIGFRHFNVINFGVGSTMVTKGRNESYMSTKEYESSLAAAPEIVILQFGTNDAKKGCWDSKKFVEDYTAMINSYRELSSKPLVLVCIPPPSYSNSSIYGIQENIVNAEIPRIVPEVVERTGAILVDNFAALGGKSLRQPDMFVNKTIPFGVWPNDGIHPNDVGYKAIANNIASVLREHLGAHAKRRSKINSADNSVSKADK
jgi:lysophospholipase L1-like esterase